MSTLTSILSATAASVQPDASWRRALDLTCSRALAVAHIDSLSSLSLSPSASSTTLALFAIRRPLPDPSEWDDHAT